MILALEGMNDLERGVTVNVGVVRGGTRPNVTPEEAHAEIDLRVPSFADAEEFVGRIPRLTSKTEGVTVRSRARSIVRPTRRTMPAPRCTSTQRRLPPRSASS